MAKKQNDSPVPGTHLPLTPATFQILMALVDGERHGYAIMTEVAERSQLNDSRGWKLLRSGEPSPRLVTSS